MLASALWFFFGILFGALLFGDPRDWPPEG